MRNVAEKEMYRLDVVVNVIGENTTKSKLSAIDKFTETTKKNLGALNRIKASPTATIQDRITAPLRTIEGRMKALNKVVAVAVRVKDEAFRLQICKKNKVTANCYNDWRWGCCDWYWRFCL